MNLRACFFPVLFLAACHLFAQDPWQTFYEKSGGTETPRYDETYRYARMLADSSAMISWLEYGTSPQGRSHFALVLDRDGLSDPAAIRARGKIILLVQACIHPGEPEGKDAGLLLLRDVAVRKKHLNLLEHVSLVFIPIVSVDGHERFGPYNRINQNGPKEMGWRTTPTNLNLNRDFLKADAPEMQAWLTLFSQWMPEALMDIHTTDGADYQYVITYAVENLGNMDPAQTQWLNERYIPVIEKSMADRGMPIFPYVSFRNWHDPRSGLRTWPSTPRYSVGYAAARNRIGILVETHMLKPYHQRVESTVELMVQTMEILNREYKSLISATREADRRCTSGELGNEPFPVTFKLSEKSTQVDFLGFSYTVKTSDLTGNDWFIYSDTPQTFTLDWFHENLPDKQIQVPKAYVIPVEWNDLIRRLQYHGIQMQILSVDTEMTVATWKFSGVRLAQQTYEGRTRVEELRMQEISRTMVFHTGSAIIPVYQQPAKIIIHALDPASPESFLQWGFFNAIFEQKEYAESYVMEKVAREMIAKNPSLLDEFKAFDATLPESPVKIWAQYNWWFEHTPYFDAMKDVYPVGVLR
ncbi:MAG TPA: M14 family metallopeptidase [Bacteroidales bacterium]|nr:M14 family metallopeptidase [Bacteroidales bacterium]HRZ47995.1 M14 family metallopeptidase [Bacteroidales bacterium]